MMLEFGASMIIDRPKASALMNGPFDLLALKLRPCKHRKVLTDGFFVVWEIYKNIFYY